ncbi:BnaC09g29850D [Brassica napus]|uniref:BnaC09g29850D protein n=2 Tax=Brassica napus TaxID=3708 RepID=A0A078HFT0_BRANA|nr:BnaC09g29850D [Brassica napus]
MAIVTHNVVRQLNDVKPFKDIWKVEIKVLHSWTQHSTYSGGDSFDFILADKTGVKIHCTCKRNFFPRVKKLQVGQWKFIENFSVIPATGKYRPTNHKYKMTITGSTNVTNSELKIEDDFLTLTPLQAIMNGSLDSKFLVDVIGRAIDIGDLQVVQVGGKEKKMMGLTLTDTKVSF